MSKPISKAIKEQVWSKTNGCCWYCGITLVRARPVDDDNRDVIHRWFVADHIVPQSQGGTDDIDNLLPACWICNSSKGTRSLEEYRLYVSMQAAGVPFFKQDQIDWLRSQGFELPVIHSYRFWGERPYAPPL